MSGHERSVADTDLGQIWGKIGTRARLAPPNRSTCPPARSRRCTSPCTASALQRFKAERDRKLAALDAMADAEAELGIG
jgi:hypothetical protein